MKLYTAVLEAKSETAVYTNFTEDDLLREIAEDYACKGDLESELALDGISLHLSSVEIEFFQPARMDAFVEIGEWDGSSYELEGDYPILRGADGKYYIKLGDIDPDSFGKPTQVLEDR